MISVITKIKSACEFVCTDKVKFVRTCLIFWYYTCDDFLKLKTIVQYDIGIFAICKRLIFKSYLFSCRIVTFKRYSGIKYSTCSKFLCNIILYDGFEFQKVIT